MRCGGQSIESKKLSIEISMSPGEFLDVKEAQSLSMLSSVALGWRTLRSEGASLSALLHVIIDAIFVSADIQ